MTKQTVMHFIAEAIQNEYALPQDVDMEKLDYMAAGYVDSMGLIRFIVDLEEQFGVEFTDEEMESQDFRVVGTLAELILSKAGAGI